MMRGGRILNFLLVAFFVVFSTLAAKAASYNVDNIPLPKTGIYPMYTSNPDGILNDYSVLHIENVLHQLEDSAGVKTLVVVVERLDNDDPHQFSLNVFNKYGVGDAKTNRGLMITLATLDRSYFISTGFGLEGDLPDAICARVENRVMVPRLKEGDWNGAITSTVDTLYSILTNNAEVINSFSQDAGETGTGVFAEDEEDDWIVSLIATLIVLFFMGTSLWLVLLIPNLIYLQIHKSKEVDIKTPSTTKKLLLNFRDSFWHTGNTYYYLDKAGNKNYCKVSGISWIGILWTILQYLLLALFLLGSSGGGGGGRSGGGRSGGSFGGGRSGGGGAGGRF